MDSTASRPRSPRQIRRRVPGGAGMAWIVGLVFSIVASVVAVVLAVALAASVVVVAVAGGVLLALASVAARARRTVKARADASSQLLEARNIGGHSWVAYGWDRGQ